MEMGYANIIYHGLCDLVKGIVRELKPNNPRAVKAGLKQLQSYIKQLKIQYPDIDWKGFLDTYSF